MLEYLKHFDINKLFIAILFFSIGSSIALILNGYIEYKFFSLPPITVRPVKIKEEKKRDYSKIAFIFKKYHQEAIVEEDKKSEEKKIVSSGTSIGNLTLVGTLILNEKKYALVKSGNETKIVSIGSIIDGFKVDEIGKFYIILLKGNDRYKLTVKIISSGTKIFSKKESKSLERTQSNAEVYKLDRRFVEQQTADIGKLLKDVFIVPVVKDGETIGFKFRYIKPGSLLYKYGFRSGDLILSVNGKPVRTVEEAFKIYNILRNENLVRIEIERRGKQKTIVYEIQ